MSWLIFLGNVSSYLFKTLFGFLCSTNIFSESTRNCRTLCQILWVSCIKMSGICCEGIFHMAYNHTKTSPPQQYREVSFAWESVSKHLKQVAFLLQRLSGQHEDKVSEVLFSPLFVDCQGIIDYRLLVVIFDYGGEWGSRWCWFSC